MEGERLAIVGNTQETEADKGRERAEEEAQKETAVVVVVPRVDGTAS